MEYAVHVNDNVKDVVIHKYPCGNIRKRGGEPGKYGQVHWKDFDELSDAEKWAQEWQTKGYAKKYCSFCSKSDKLSF